MLDERRRRKKKKKKKKEDEQNRNFSCLVFSNLLKVSGVFRIDLAIE